MKRLIALMAVAVLLVPTVALASDITNATYYSIITVSNNGTAADDVFTTFPLSTQNLIDSNFLSANLTDCAMHDTSGVDTAFMPSVNATYPWCFHVSHIGEDAFRNYLLYTGGNTDMDGKLRYFPATGGMTSTDSATIELSDNFTIEQKGWIDTDNNTDKNLVYKKGAFSLYVSPTVSENITAAILEWSANFTEVRRPDGHDTCIIPSETGAVCNDHWQNVDDAGTGDDAATEVHCLATGATTYTDIYTLEDTSINATSQIMHITTTVKGQVIGSGQYRVGLELDGDTTWGALFTDGAYTTHNEVLARPGGGSWELADLDDLKIMVYVVAGGAAGNGAWVTQCYITTTFQNPVETVSVSAIDVESGEHTIIVTTDNTTLFFGIGKDIVNADFPITENLTLNAPLWHTELDGSPFTTKDATEHTCTVTGATWTSDGGDFDGNDLIAIADFPFLDLDSDFTLIIWIKFDGVAASQCLLAHSNEATNNRQWMLYLTGGKVKFIHSSNGAAWNLTAVNGANAKVINTWYCVAITRTGTTYQIYEDGVTDGTPVGEGTAHFATNVDGSIGSRVEGGTYLDGLVGEVLMYDRCLSPTELLQNHTATRWKYETSDEYFHYNLLPAGGVLDSAYDWTFIENYSMPYMEHHKIWIDGVLRQHIEYEYDDAVFSDLSGNGQDATPTFRGASSDADVSGIMASFRPVSEAQAPAWVLTEERDFFSENITATGNFTTTPAPTDAPGVAVIVAISEASGTPTQLPFTVIAGFVILAVSLTGTWFLAKHGSRNLWLKIILITILMAVCVAVRVLDFWMIVFFLIMAIAVALFSRQRSTV